MQLTAVVSASQLANEGTFPVQVVTPGPGGGSSTPANLSVTLVVAVTPRNPTLLVSQTQAFAAAVAGSSNQAVSWSVNGMAGGNASVGTIDAACLYTAPLTPPSPNTLTVTATSSADSARSASASLTILNPAPWISSLAPSSVNAGSSNTLLTVSGNGFTPQSAVKLGGVAAATSYVSATQLTATAPAAQLTTANMLSIQVVNPDPGGGTSSTTNLAVQIVVGVMPPSGTVFIGQTQTFTANVTGSANQAVSWSVNGTVGGNTTVGTIDASGLYTAPVVPPIPNTLTLTATSVADPTRAAAVVLTIVYPTPVLSSITPNLLNAGSSDTVVSVFGAGFTPQSTVKFGGAPAATTYASATQLTATIPAVQLASAGTIPVMVVTPAPGGGASSAASLIVALVVGVTPPAPTLLVGQPQPFAATISGNANQAVGWSVNGV